MQTLDISTTALVLIDLQKGILANTLAPHSAEAVVDASRKLADGFRSLGGAVILVTVDWRPGFVDALSQPVDQPIARAAEGPTADFADLVPDLGAQDSDVRVTKRQWGAFYGTELDLQLRRRGVTTLVLGGVATNMGVESTARDAWELAYAVVFAEDAISSFTTPMHDFAVKTIFPRIGRVATTNEILSWLKTG